MTEPEWWELLGANWESLLDLIETYHPALARKDRVDGQITAENAEIACEEFRKEILETYNRLPDLEAIKAAHNFGKMSEILSETWYGIPESRETVIELGMAFNVLCRLCEGVDE